MSELVIGVIIGAIGALLIAALVATLQFKRAARRQRDDLADREAAILELRQEGAEDKETNRRLRHELAVKTPGHLLQAASTAEMERDGAVSERNQAIEQLDLVQRDLATAKTRLTEQDAKLRQYREALQEIRLSLEAQGRGRTLAPASAAVLDEGDLVEPPANPPMAAGGAPMAAAPEPVDLGAGD